ncbi:uncharacterized protein N7529_008278 [Penicillium soppii]|uniref:uncharacterized protein n=1 Tax=Penicillium soppii TaxID=69789 RepID=UPI002546E2F6|nr:uncharacterized protein N7529_008278 [Penicillium soppii]KAJ5860968.1 hypothetical protein N7529_008278 [Penicillium soppii]
MRAAYTLVADLWKRRNIVQSIMDPSEVIINRCTLELLYLKGIVVLDRRYIGYEYQDPKIEGFRRSCVKAAHLRFSPVKQTCIKCSSPVADSRKIIYDFLPAATVGCPDLSVRLESQSTFRDESEMNGLVSKGILALKQSQKIRVSNSHNTSESRVASLALDLMVRRAAEIQAASSCDRAMQSTGHSILDQNLQDPGLGASYLESTDDMATLFSDISDSLGSHSSYREPLGIFFAFYYSSYMPHSRE